MKTTKQLLGARIKELRKARDISQGQLAEKVNIDSKHLSRIEVGGSYPSLDTLESIARELHHKVEEFFVFQHLDTRDENLRQINDLLSEAGEEDIRMILKIILAVLK